MFKTRWRNDRNKTKAVFRLQFQASQIPQPGWEAAVVSLIPNDLGKPTAKSEKAVVVDGACSWEKPVFETVRLSRDPKTGKANEKVYRIVVSTPEVPKGKTLGEVSLDFADYVEGVKPTSVALPLKASSSSPSLHITIQRMQGDAEIREPDQNVVPRQRKTLQSHFENFYFAEPNNAQNYPNTAKDTFLSNNQGQPKFSSARVSSLQTESNRNQITNLRSLDTLSVSESENGMEWYTLKADTTKTSHNNFLLPLEGNIASQKPRINSADSIADSGDHRRSTTDCSLTSAPDGSSDGSTNSLDDAGITERPQDADSSPEKLRREVISLSRRVDVSELELQALRKQVAKERRQGEDLLKELCMVRNERDAIKRNFELLKASEIKIGIERMNLQFDGEDLKPLVEEMERELDLGKNLSANLLQLQNTLESNSKPIENHLPPNAREASCLQYNQDYVCSRNKQSNGLSSAFQKEINNESCETVSEHEDNEELEILASVQDVEEECSLQQKIADLNAELELYKTDRDDIEMQMEQLALDFEIIKQENHDLSLNLEQSQIREQLKTQYECAAHLSLINDLEAHVEELENELERQAEAFEEDLASIATARIEQEQRAIRAEKTLHEIKLSFSSAAENLQDEFKRLAIQMSDSFSRDEKLTMQAQAEAEELRMRNKHLEQSMQKAMEELSSLKYQFKIQVLELLRQIDMKIDYESELLLKLKNKSAELEEQKKSDDMLCKALFEEISMLKVEIETLSEENNKLSQHPRRDYNLMGEMEKVSISEKSVQEDAVEELSNLRRLKDENDRFIAKLCSDLEALKVQCEDLKASFSVAEMEKEELREQVLELKCDIRNKEGSLEKKLNDTNTRATASDGAARTALTNNCRQCNLSHGYEEFAKLQEEIRILEELKVRYVSTGIMKRPDSRNCIGFMKISDLVEEDKLQLEMKEINDVCCNGNGDSAMAGIFASKSTETTVTCSGSCGQTLESDITNQKYEAMGAELREMRNRYLETSLKLAEVECERQELVMTIRALKNSTKN